jgi:O-antigen/teichoic acid export membrane protein
VACKKQWQITATLQSTLNDKMIARHIFFAHGRSLLARGRQSGWGMAEYFAYPLMMFAATPAFLSLLGTAQYGQWMLLLTFNGFGGLAGLGMGTAAIKEVSAHRGRDDIMGAANAVRNCFAITLASSTLLSLILILVGLATGPTLLAKMGPPDQVYRIIIAAAFLIAFEQVDTVFAGAIRGLERFDISARIEASTKLVMVLAALVAAWITHDLISVIWVTIAITLGRTAIKAIVATKLLKSGPLWPQWDRKIIARVFQFGKWTWAQSIGAAMFATADRLIVGSVLGATALAHYSICLQLAQQIQTVPAAGAQVVFPMISRRIEQGDDIRTFALKAMLWLAGFAVLLAVPVILFSHTMLSLWVGDSIANDSATTLMMLAISFAVLAMNVVPHYGLMGLGRARVVALWNMIAGLAAILFVASGVHDFGQLGASFGRLGYAIIIAGLTPIFLIAIRRNDQSNDLNLGGNYEPRN